MFAKIFSAAVFGLEGLLVEIEVDVSSRGLPSFKIVGLPGKAIEEAKERLRSALLNNGVDFPRHNLTVNLAPADLPKEGSVYDLPLAVGILLASGQLDKDFRHSLFLGELSLNGSLRPVKGVLPMAMLARQKGLREVFLPVKSAPEAALVKGLTVYPVASLKELLAHFKNLQPLSPFVSSPVSPVSPVSAEFDLAQIRGQQQAKRALEIAAAGGHNLFLRGVPGAGKTMLARCLPGILPPLTNREALEVSRIYSVAGQFSGRHALVRVRPFRSPHHTISQAGLVGGGTVPRPGEISLAHRGVLFLDELPEFPRSVLETLRQPLEDGRLTITRAAGSVTFPAVFTLIAASNPCPCGWWGSQKHPCRCSPGEIIRYQRKISGPLLDRFDLFVELAEVPLEKLTAENSAGESSLSVCKRVTAARYLQTARFKGTRLKTNAEMANRQIEKFCPLSRECLALLRQAVAQLNFSARAYFKTIKVARTIADLAGAAKISAAHLAEALQYRCHQSFFE